MGKSIQVWWLFLNCGFALLGELLLFPRRKRSNQEKGRPVPQSVSAALQRIPCALRSWRRERKLALSGSDTRSLLPPAAPVLGCSNGTIHSESFGATVLSVGTRLPLWRRREAQVCIGPERALFESRSVDRRGGRVAQRPMQTEHRREPEGRRNRGALFLAYFFLGTQKEVGRQLAKQIIKIGQQKNKKPQPTG